MRGSETATHRSRRKSAFLKLAALYAQTPIETIIPEIARTRRQRRVLSVQPFADAFRMHNKTLSGQLISNCAGSAACAVSGGDCNGDRTDCFGS